MTPLIVGLHNPLSTHPDDALVPWPKGCTGDRLLGFMQQIDPAYDADQYLHDFERMNLWRGRRLPQGRGATAAYRTEGEAIYEYVLDHHTHVVILGVRVWDSMLGRTAPSFFDKQVKDDTVFWYMPHPSGRNLLYRSALNQRRAGEMLFRVLTITKRETGQ